MSSQIFLNIPVKDLPKSVSFFTALGFKFNPQFTDEKATCMIINDHAFVMLLVEPFFQTFTPKSLVNAHQSTEAMIGISVENPEKVDEMVNTAIASGGTEARAPQDLGFMYTRSVNDPDGHIWEFFWMDPSGMAPQ